MPASKKLKVEAQPDGSSLYTTIDGDMVDHIAFEFYGTHDGTTELLDEANRDIVKMDMVLPAGIKIRLPPAAPVTSSDTRIKLWD